MSNAAFLVVRQALFVNLHELALRWLNLHLTILANCQFVQGVTLRGAGQMHGGEHALFIALIPHAQRRGVLCG